MKRLLYALGRRAAPTVLKTRWIYRALTGTESERIEAEYLVGCHLASLAIREATLVEDPKTTDWLQTILDRLSLTLVNRERKFQIRCVQNSQPNAFALPGGFLFITDSLLELCDFDPDEIAFVIGHEMAHVLRSHSLNRLLASKVIGFFSAGKPLQRVMQPALRRLIQQLATQGYSRRQEFEADSAAFKIIRVAGYSPDGAFRLFDRLSQTSQAPDGFGTYFSSHPPLSARIERLQQKLQP